MRTVVYHWNAVPFVVPSLAGKPESSVYGCISPVDTMMEHIKEHWQPSFAAYFETARAKHYEPLANFIRESITQNLEKK